MNASLRKEWPLPVGLSITGIFLIYGQELLDDLHHPFRFTLVLLTLLLIILFSIFAVVRHAEGLARHFGEPAGTLILTLSVSAIEVMILMATMSAGDGSPTLARDTMFAILMIVLNGMVGLTLLVGGLRFHEQDYNLQGANAFLAVILPLAVLALVLPNLTTSSADQTFSSLQATFLTFVSLVLYGIFLMIQSVRHRAYFLSSQAELSIVKAIKSSSAFVLMRSTLLVIYIGLLAVLAKQVAVPISFTITVHGAPVALAGLLVAVLILLPESIAALRAALSNDLQRAVNILLGSALATISLTIPAVLAFGLYTHTSIVLGLDPIDVTVLALTLAVTMLTFTSTRTNVLQGAVHLVLFFSYLLLIFQR